MGALRRTRISSAAERAEQTDYISIELEHVYRQSDPEFIGLLNKVRDDYLDAESLRKLNSRFVPNFRPPGKDAFITLTATNAVAYDINARNLKQLCEPAAPVYQATIAGEFPESAYPTEVTLEFKKDAQVMFVKNDSQPVRRYFNGKIGRIRASITTRSTCVVRKMRWTSKRGLAAGSGPFFVFS